jgi:hypothetical protein
LLDSFLTDGLASLAIVSSTYVGLTINNRLIIRYRCSVDDLASLDPVLYKGLIYVKDYKGNVEDLALNFTVAKNGKYIWIS